MGSTVGAGNTQGASCSSLPLGMTDGVAKGAIDVAKRATNVAMYSAVQVGLPTIDIGWVMIYVLAAG